METLPSRIDEYESLLNANPIWLKRTKGVGLLPVDEMLESRNDRPLYPRRGHANGRAQNDAVFELREVRFQRADIDR